MTENNMTQPSFKFRSKPKKKKKDNLERFKIEKEWKTKIIEKFYAK